MNAPANQPELWLRGPVPDVSADLQPVAHALLQALEDIEGFMHDVDTHELWVSIGGAATLGFHLRHIAGALDRLLTYARAEPLTDLQRIALAAEKHTHDLTAEQLLADLRTMIEHALAQLRSTAAGTLDEPRAVGRAGLPSTVRGLLYHAGEHTARHAGQISTTVRIIRGLRTGPRTGG